MFQRSNEKVWKWPNQNPTSHLVRLSGTPVSPRDKRGLSFLICFSSVTFRELNVRRRVKSRLKCSGVSAFFVSPRIRASRLYIQRHRKAALLKRIPPPWSLMSRIRCYVPAGSEPQVASRVTRPAGKNPNRRACSAFLPAWRGRVLYLQLGAAVQAKAVSMRLVHKMERLTAGRR